MRLIILFSLCIFAAPGQSTEPDETTTPAPPSFLGTYTLSSSNLFEEYMIALDVGWFLRRLSAHAYPTTTISKSGDDWTITTSTTFKTTIINFKLGEEFDEVTADGRTCKSIITLVSDNKLMHVQNCAASMNTEIIRVFGNNHMNMSLPFPNNDSRICERIYTKQ